MLRALDAHVITLASIQLARPTLDDVFLTLTGRSLRDDSPSANGRSGRSSADPEQNKNDTGDPELTGASAGAAQPGRS